MSGSQVVVHRAYGPDTGRSGQDRPGRGLSLVGLAWRQLRLRRAWTASVGLGLALAFGLAGTVPLAATMAADAALHSAVSSPREQARLTVAQQGVSDLRGFESAEARIAGRVEGRLGPYLAGSSSLGTLGPLKPVSLNENPAPAQVDSSRLAVGYLRDLADRVELVAGGVPPDGLGGSADIAATMAQSEADALGMHLGDRLCLDFTTGGARWCVRVAGLWQPLASGDPFRLEPGRQVELVVGRYDFYRLMKLASSPVATVGRQFYVDADTLDSRAAGDLVSGLQQLRAYFGGRGELFDTSLDQVIRALDARQHSQRLAAAVLAASLAALVLQAATFGAAQLLRLQQREVGLARARGWPRRRIRRLLMLQVGGLVGTSLLVGAGLAAAAGLALGQALFAVPLPWPHPSGPLSLLGPLLALAALLGLSWLVLSALTAQSVRSGSALRPSGSLTATDRKRSRASGWLAFFGGLALLGASRLCQQPPSALSRLASVQAGFLDLLTAVAAALALLLLAWAAAHCLPLAGSLAGGGGSGIAPSLARWQLQRRPDQHRQTAFLLTLAAALGVLGPLAALAGPHLGPDLPGAAVQVGSGGAALLVALFVFAVHFRALAAERAEEYASLLLSGLPRRTLRRSLAIEQRAVIWLGLVGGSLVGVAAALALAPGSELAQDLAGPRISLAVIAVLLLPFLAGLLVAGWAVRAWLGRLRPGDQLRALT